MHTDTRAIVSIHVIIVSDSFVPLVYIEAMVKVAKEKLLSQIELYQDQENQRSSPPQTQDKRSSSRLHQRSSDNDADPAIVGVSEDKGLSLTSQPLNKQEL